MRTYRSALEQAAPFARIGPTGGGRSKAVFCLSVRSWPGLRPGGGAMSRRTLTVDQYKELERLLAVRAGIRGTTRAEVFVALGEADSRWRASYAGCA